MFTEAAAQEHFAKRLGLQVEQVRVWQVDELWLAEPQYESEGQMLGAGVVVLDPDGTTTVYPSLGNEAVVRMHRTGSPFPSAGESECR